MGVEILFKNFVGLPFLRFEHRNLTKWFDEVKRFLRWEKFKKASCESWTERLRKQKRLAPKPSPKTPQK